MLLSACMIMKNEEWTIRRCLESMVDVVDEIVIVDTGSTDASVQIAQELGATVYAYEWKNDFSDARNESMRHAHGDFVLYIDADEYLDEVQKRGIRNFLASSTPDGVMIQLRNYVGTLSHMTPMVPIPVTRIFRRGYLFSGAIHEQILATIETQGGVIKEYPLTIHHVGYLREFVEKKEKSNRNIEILRTELRRDPGNFFHQTNLLAEYIRSENYEQAAELSSEIISKLRSHPASRWPYYSARVFSHGLTALERTGRQSAAQALAREATELFPKLPEFRKRYAVFLMRDMQFTQALVQLNRCREIGEQKNASFDMLEGYGSYYAAADIGAVWLELGDQLTARKWFIQAFIENSHLEFSLIPILCLMPPHAETLEKHFETRISDAQAYGTYAEIYAALEYPNAEQVLARAESRFGLTGLTMRARLSLLLLHGGLLEVEGFVHKNPTENNWLMLGLRHWEEERYEEALQAFGRAGERGLQASQLMTGERRMSTGNEPQGKQQQSIELLPLFRDMACMHTDNLVQRLAPRAKDLKEFWNYMKIGPFKHVASQIAWQGNTLHECEDNALQAFSRKDFTACATWLRKAERFQTTVATTLLRCDLHLAEGDLTKARHVLFKGKELFPESEMIKVVSPQVFGKVAQS